MDEIHINFTTERSTQFPYFFLTCDANDVRDWIHQRVGQPEVLINSPLLLPSWKTCHNTLSFPYCGSLKHQCYTTSPDLDKYKVKGSCVIDFNHDRDDVLIHTVLIIIITCSSYLLNLYLPLMGISKRLVFFLQRMWSYTYMLKF